MAASSKRSEDVSDLSPKKKPTKHICYQEYRNEYGKEFDLILLGKKGSSFAFCGICACDVSIWAGDKQDITSHSVTEKRKESEKKAKASKKNLKITGFLVKDKMDDTDAEVIEMMMVDLVMELNLPLFALDKLSKASKLMFPDSKKFQFGRSKGTVILKEISAKFQFCFIIKPF